MINIRGFVVLALVCLAWSAALAHDHDALISQWMATLMQPGTNVPCCGVSDAYFADAVSVRRDPDGTVRVFATITDDRDDVPLGRHHVPPGTQIEIPQHVLKHDAGNPTGHQLVFLNINNVALCFVQGSGI